MPNLYKCVICEVLCGKVNRSKEYDLTFVPFIGMHVDFDTLHCTAKVVRVGYIHAENKFFVYCEY